MRHQERFGGNHLKGFQVTPLGINFHQLGMDSDARRVGAQCFLQDFLSL